MKSTPYKVADREGNIFVYAYHENGHPVYRTDRGSKHIFDLEFYTIIEEEAPQ